MIELIRDVYRYRELIWALALKELKIRYKRSVLGFMWALLNPLLLMVVLTLVFSNILRASVPHYAVFMLSGLLPWMFFAQSLAYSAESVVGNAALITKVRVPKSVFPVAAVVSNMINLLLSFIPLLLIVPATGMSFFWTWVYLPVAFIALSLFTLGASFFFATANVYYRDITHIVQVVLNVWFYLTPIIYLETQFPTAYRWVFKLNPIVYVLHGFQLSIYGANGQYGLLPQMPSIIASFICGFASLIIGFWIFKRYQDEFV
ncbi:MAG: ABC transporter permease, partial [Bryobacteraceae bacterium]